MVQEHGPEHASQWAAITSIAGKLGCTPQTLRTWLQQAERDAEQADIEGMVAGRIGRYRGQVMNAGELHGGPRGNERTKGLTVHIVPTAARGKGERRAGVQAGLAGMPATSVEQAATGLGWQT